ncbi:protein FAR1-RELATED SEQUENCE 5 [Artemisia annua]|uniref:Protein FAR1-RELATED SEQUENCE 5 n=1 Tax=Artemisia annua TaxID=35608 RepID=A0A2U1NV31_ARTAN|nr:protein FAR1-RELATED SEQUENCE 5 [Artemisia annua]
MAPICSKIYDETDFKKKFNQIVWNMYIGPEEFEDRWGKLLDEFSLHTHKWLTKMFRIRSCWIPAYFIDSPLCGLMRMTSRSESENSFFSHFTNQGSTLMNFMNCFETAMEKQRHIQERPDHKTIDSVRKFRTYHKIEKYASKVYTRPLFERVQAEIFTGTWYCQIETKSLLEGSEVSVIRETKFVEALMEKRKAKLKEKAKKRGKNKGKDNDKAEEEEPVKLFYKVDALYKEQKEHICEKNEIIENYANESSSIVDHCVHMLSKDEPRLSSFVEKLRLLKIDVEADCPNPPSKNKADNLEELVGVPKPAENTVNNPALGNPKGRKKLCIKGGKEQALDKNSKNRNACSLCGETRTYPKKFAEEAELDQAEVTIEGDSDQS